MSGGRRITSFLQYAGCHLVASLISIILPVLLVVVAYIVLFIIAIVTNSGLGSPIALPLWMVFTFIASTAYTTVLLFPAVALAEVAARPFGKWRYFAEIPVSIVFLAAIIAFLETVRILTLQPPVNWGQEALYTLAVFIVLILPLCIYWGALKGTQATIFGIESIIRWIRKNNWGQTYLS